LSNELMNWRFVVKFSDVWLVRIVIGIVRFII